MYPWKRTLELVYYKISKMLRKKDTKRQWFNRHYLLPSYRLERQYQFYQYMWQMSKILKHATSPRRGLAFNHPSLVVLSIRNVHTTSSPSCSMTIKVFSCGYKLFDQVGQGRSSAHNYDEQGKASYWKWIICRSGLPKWIILDNGTQFYNSKMVGFYKYLGIHTKFILV